MNSLKFLEELYPDKPDNAHILLWHNKKSDWFTDIEKAAQHIDDNQDDMYYGVGLSPKNFGKHKRCKADHIMGIPGLYADIDIGQGSKKYPPTATEALDLIKGEGMEPTLVVNSGNGLHVYWLFKEIWLFDDEAERNYAANLSKRMNWMIKERAIKKGYAIDNVGDLARILRPIGSMNCKGDPKKPVEIMFRNGPKYSDPDYFDKLLPLKEVYNISPHEKVTPQELERITRIINLKKTAEPPQAKLDLLLESDPDFKEYWQREKEKRKDTSPSGYHWDLARTAAQVGWNKQEITNLLIAWNRRHGIELEKLMERADYVAGTIARAQKSANKFYTDKYTDELENLSGTEFQDAQKETNKKKALEILSHHVGFRIFGIIKYIQERKPKYRMQSTKGDITFTGPEELMQKAKFEQKILAATNKALALTRKNFEVLKSTYEHIIDDVVVSKESTIESRMKAWLTEYLDDKAFLDQHEAVIGNQPFVYNGQWHIYSTSFKEWAFRNRHDREAIDKTEFDLKIIGAQHKRFNPLDPDNDKRRITKRPWEIPLDVVKPGIV